MQLSAPPPVLPVPPQCDVLRVLAPAVPHPEEIPAKPSEQVRTSSSSEKTPSSKIHPVRLRQSETGTKSLTVSFELHRWFFLSWCVLKKTRLFNAGRHSPTTSTHLEGVRIEKLHIKVDPLSQELSRLYLSFVKGGGRHSLRWFLVTIKDTL